MPDEDINSVRPNRVFVRLSIMGLDETLGMAVVRKGISKRLSMVDETEEVPGEVLVMLNAYRDAVERLTDAMDTTARSRAMVGYLLLKADAYRAGGWLNHWRSALDEAEENAHYAQLLDEFEENLELLYNLSLHLILGQYSPDEVDGRLYEVGSGNLVRLDSPEEFAGLNQEELLGLVFTALIDSGEDPDEYLTRFGLL